MIWETGLKENELKVLNYIRKHEALSEMRLSAYCSLCVPPIYEYYDILKKFESMGYLVLHIDDNNKLQIYVTEKAYSDLNFHIEDQYFSLEDCDEVKVEKQMINYEFADNVIRCSMFVVSIILMLFILYMTYE